MTERRAPFRHPVPGRVEVLNPVSGVAVGFTATLSAEGFMLACSYEMSPIGGAPEGELHTVGVEL